jgi:hypothetical protein
VCEGPTYICNSLGEATDLAAVAGIQDVTKHGTNQVHVGTSDHPGADFMNLRFGQNVFRRNIYHINNYGQSVIKN